MNYRPGAEVTQQQLDQLKQQVQRLQKDMDELKQLRLQIQVAQLRDDVNRLERQLGSFTARIIA